MANIHNQILPIGCRLGVYEIKEATKTDVFDITYRGWNHHLKEWVEILEYFPYDLVTRATDGLGVEVNSQGNQEKFDFGFKAFLDQAEALIQIEHPNLVETENVLQFHGTVYIVSSHYEGLALTNVARSPATIADAELSYILESTLNGLQKVHERNIVHCGIRPDTVILGKDGEALLTGFDGARLDLAAYMDKLPDLVITDFSAPELSQPGIRRGPASDFYALGATLYYCVFNKLPPVYQARMLALSKGQTDPLSLAAPPASQYSPALLQAIDWMLKPRFSERPQSVGEILARLNSAHANNQAGSTTAKQNSARTVSNFTDTKKPVWLGVAAGIVGITFFGFWLSSKTPEVVTQNENPLSNHPLPQRDQNQQTETTQSEHDNPVILSASSQPNPPSTPEITVNPSKQQAEPATEYLPKSLNATNKPSPSSKAMANSALPNNQSVSEHVAQVNALAKNDSNKNRKITTLKQSKQLSKKRNASQQPFNTNSVEGYLAAAKQAMKAVRFTTPPGNNAYHYYQLVLAKDPNNQEALAGKQKIVNRYAWFIRKSKSIGEIGRAERVLKKAESVSPNDPKLRQIREELQNQ